MILKKLTTNMMVGDVNSTIEFYSNVLGFEVVMVVPENSQEVLTTVPKDRVLIYALMKCGNVEIMFQARRSLIEDLPLFKDTEIGASLTFYIEVEDIKGWYEKLKNNITIVKDIHTTFYGMQEFYIKDCNGYILAFTEGGN